MVLQELLSAHPALSPLASTLASTGCPAPHICHAWVCTEGVLTFSSGQCPVAVGNRAALVSLPNPTGASGSFLHVYSPPHHGCWAAAGAAVLSTMGTTLYYRGLNNSFSISAHPKDKSLEKLSFSFPFSILALRWEWDFGLRNNKPNNRQCVTTDPQLAEGACERCSGIERQSIRKVLMDTFFHHGSTSGPSPLSRPHVSPQH